MSIPDIKQIMIGRIEELFASISGNVRVCSIEGCGKIHYAKGFCNAHYRRLKIHGHPLSGRLSSTERGMTQKYYSEVVLRYEGDECLTWPFSRNSDGYAHMRKDGKVRVVSRLVCEAAQGPPLRTEKVILGMCS